MFFFFVLCLRSLRRTAEIYAREPSRYFKRLAPAYAFSKAGKLAC
ncbi:hypothetical protein PLO_1479 [Pediococcus acidilactici NGRI 0510Q]|nr:hypothetical protein PLO_1479 [Pediococcus acidilactici NGRI 0510Q]